MAPQGCSLPGGVGSSTPNAGLPLSRDRKETRNMEVVPSVSSELRAVRFIRLPEVKQITGLGKTTLYALMKEGVFPAPVPLSGRAVGWVAEEVAQWCRGRIAEARLAPSQSALRLAA